MKIPLLFAAGEIPELKPPRGEIPPTYLEEHGWTPMIVSALVALVLGLIIAWILRRPQQVAPVSPADTARRALESLRGRPEDPGLIIEVSQTLRRYVINAFTPAQEELTTDELARVLANDNRVQPGTRSALGEFLRYCDVQKFAPVQPPLTPGLVEQGLSLVEQFEAERMPVTMPGSTKSA